MAREPAFRIELVNVEFTRPDAARVSQRVPLATFWFNLSTDDEERVRLAVRVSGATRTYDDLFHEGHAALRDLLLGWARRAEQMAPTGKPSEQTACLE